MAERHNNRGAEENPLSLRSLITYEDIEQYIHAVSAKYKNHTCTTSNMAHCDLCGKETALTTVIVEGTDLDVCATCGSYGKEKPQPRYWKQRQRQRHKEQEITDSVIPGFAELIKNTREQRGLKQADFAQIIKEKASIIHKIETGTLEPSLRLAKKIERTLRIKLISPTDENEVEPQQRQKGGAMTIGDMIKKR
jgi:putative transcription factor